MPSRVCLGRGMERADALNARPAGKQSGCIKQYVKQLFEQIDRNTQAWSTLKTTLRRWHVAFARV